MNLSQQPVTLTAYPTTQPNTPLVTLIVLTMAYLKVLLIRHAQSMGNLQGQMEGQSSTELSEQGHKQARKLSQRLIESHPLPTHMYSSPLRRAAQTAQALHNALQDNALQLAHHLADHQPVKYQQVEDLQEMHQGIFQGLTWDQAQAQYSNLCNQLLSSLSWHPVPEAESLVAARQRAQKWIDHILSVHQPGETLWAISHEGILQHLVAAILGCDRTWKIEIAHTAIFEFWLAQTPEQTPSSRPNLTPWQHLTHDRFNPEFWQVRHFNDSSHLMERPVI